MIRQNTLRLDAHFAVLLVLLVLVPTLTRPAAAMPDFQPGFPATLNGSSVRASSVALADLTGDNLPELVVGGTDGVVHAYTGTGAVLWDFDTGSMAIEAKAAIADIDGDGFNEVVISAGSTTTPNADGGLYVISHDGNLQCTFETNDDGDADAFLEGIYSSPALADLDGNDSGLLEIAFGAWDRFVRVINHDCTIVWAQNVVDTTWSSPAIGDIDRDGQLDVVIGVASDDEPAPNGELEGGILHAFNGATGAELAGFPIQIDETIQSSPALGDLTGDGNLDIVVGTGRCWADPICAPDGPNPGVGEYINAWDHNGNELPGWPVDVPNSYAFSSPALGDLDGDGDLEVVINTIDPDDSQAGMVYALNANGSNVPGWPVLPTTPADGMGNVRHTSTGAGPVLADVTGDGDLEIILPSSFELVIWDRFGNQLTRDSLPPGSSLVLASQFLITGSAAVADLDGDGDLEIAAAGALTGGTVGALYAWDMEAPASSEALAWPMFRNSADNRAALSDIVFVDDFESGDLSAW